MKTTRHSHAFTLVELLVVIGIIALLIGILMPTIRKAQLMARQCKGASDLRQLMVGYKMYHQENRGALLLGYTPPVVNGWPVTVDDPVSGHQFGLPVADRYPWRLLPYCSRIWSILHSHDVAPPAPTRGNTPAVALMRAYMLSLNPTFGLNAIYLGGHASFDGFAGDRPNVGKHVAFRASEVRRSSEQIVFAESQTRNGPFTDPSTGLHYLTPPRAGGEKWRVVNEQFVLTTGTIVGLPAGRWSKRALVGFFDGHVESALPSELTDMRRWAPRAASNAYDYIP